MTKISHGRASVLIAHITVSHARAQVSAVLKPIQVNHGRAEVTAVLKPIQIHHGRVEVSAVLSPIQINHTRAEVSALLAPIHISHARAELSALQAPISIRHGRLEIGVPPITPTRLSHAYLKVAAPVVPSAGPDLSGIEPGDLVVLTGIGGDGGTALWTQISGPAVLNPVQDGASYTFRAPGMSKDGVLKFRYSVSGAFDDVDVSVLHSVKFLWDGAAWVPSFVLPF